MIDGFVFICPTGSYMGADQYEKVFCSSNGVSAWQMISVSDFAAEIGAASGAVAAESNTGLAAEDYDTLWAACVLFLILGVGIKMLKSIFTPNRG